MATTPTGLTLNYEPGTTFAVEFGGHTPDGYDQISEAGPFRTFIGAWLYMRLHQGRKLRFTYKMGQVEGERGDRILGATICAYTDDLGTYHRWDYTPRGKLTESY